ncbi:MAG: hypothetical protein CYPHOPRED_004453 [Cyphobasidiales sp. Tagirdzhanova-0007]|nr:MAG: hypothetical protein CYPHOPRED_004453 [Cyphobasidiales sp. Tagirdzhanova-0007]
MRRVAQPVAVITANLQEASLLERPDHGATVSSFVSITLSPTPLVAFSLRLPSRLATYLMRSALPSQAPTFKIHILAQSQENIARAFARQLSLPHTNAPSSAAAPTSFEPFDEDLFQDLAAASLGVLDCSMAARLNLVYPVPTTTEVQEEHRDMSASGDAASQLFIAKVWKAHMGDDFTRPLLYCHRTYCGIA